MYFKWYFLKLVATNAVNSLNQVQLLIRNDTTVGTVIMNTFVHDKLPISKSGKNGIMIIAANEVIVCCSTVLLFINFKSD